MDESKRQTMTAFARLACTLASTGAAMAGLAVDADALYTGVTVALALACYLWSWWKNNNVTAAATDAQAILDAVKAGAVIEEEDGDE